MDSKQSRRQFISSTAVGVGIAVSGLNSSAQAAPRTASAQTNGMAGKKPKFELGMASYTLRKFNLDQTLEMTKRVGLTNIAFKDFHLAMNSTAEQIRTVAAKTKTAGLNLYGCGVVYMKNEAEVNRAFDYAKTGGMKVIIGVPSPELLPLVDRKVKEYGILVAIHNHGPGDKVYPVPETIYEKVKGLDKQIGICMDIGHTQRMGIDPASDAKRFADRLLDVHIKDVSAATARGSTVEIGRGVIDIPKFLQTLIEIGYTGKVSFEYEKDADDPLAGLAESVGYVKGVLATLA
ncbi:MAG: sugar phosphate isomerase/epimerase [Sedimentisphaerales bacterium]|nr:sugar phosphate isomerase/epimerase [Sedimentisphaerales bacterium]